MPAVGSQMLSDVSSGIGRYYTLDSLPADTDTTTGTGTAVKRSAATATFRLPVRPETVSTESRGVSCDVPERKRLTSSLESATTTTGSAETDFDFLHENMYLDGGGLNPGSGRRDAVSIADKIHATRGIWFLPELDRQTAELYLGDFEIGVFIIRASSLKSRTLALSVNIPQAGSNFAEPYKPTTTSPVTGQRVEHYLIESSGQPPYEKLALEGSEISFSSLPGLVRYYAENRNELPVPLRLPHLIDQVESREDLLLLAQVANPADFWTSIAGIGRLNQSVNIDISSPSSTASSSASAGALSFSMLLDATDTAAPATSKLQLPHGSVFARKLRDSARLSPDSTSGNISADEQREGLMVNGQSRLSSKVSDYEDVWSLGGTKSPDYTMPSSLDGSTPDRSSSLEYRETEPNRAKAVGLALRDLDALGDWIESELHDQRHSPKETTASSTPDSTTESYENYHPDVTVVKEENRVIRRGKRRFAGAQANSRNRFSAPNLGGVNVEDLVNEAGEDGDLNGSVNADSIYSSVRDISERETVTAQQEPGDGPLQQPVDDFVCYTPPRKCVPCKDPNILEAFQSKVGALKRIGSKLLQRKSSLKTVSSHGTLARGDSPTSAGGGHRPSSPLSQTTTTAATSMAQERVMVFRTKKAGYDTCWPVDNGNWNVINRATPTISDISSGTSSSTGSAGAKSTADVNMNGKYLSIRSSKSPAGSLPKRSKTFSDFTDPSHDLEREITLERTVNFIMKSTKADFNISLQINEFLQRFAATPVDNTDDLFTDLRLFLTTSQAYILAEHRTNLEDFIARDNLGSMDAKRPSGVSASIVAAVQRLIVEPLCPKLIWNLQNKLGTSGEFSRLEKGCAVFDGLELTADDVQPEIQAVVIEKLAALMSHFKSLAEAQNLLTKAKQLYTIFSDIFGIDADPLEYSFSDTISAFAMAIAKAKAYNVEVHLDFIWQLQAVDGSCVGYLPVLLAASCATTVLKSFATDAKLRLPEAVARCMTPVSISIKSRDDCPVISHNFQVPLDRHLLANQLASLLAAICDLNSDSSDMTLRLSAGCLGLVQAGDTALKAALDRWRTVYPDCRYLLLAQSKKAD